MESLLLNGNHHYTKENSNDIKMISSPPYMRRYLDIIPRQFSSKRCADGDCICNTYIQTSNSSPDCNCYECKLLIRTKYEQKSSPIFHDFHHHHHRAENINRSFRMYKQHNHSYTNNTYNDLLLKRKTECALCSSSYHTNTKYKGNDITLSSSSPSSSSNHVTRISKQSLERPTIHKTLDSEFYRNPNERSKPSSYHRHHQKESNIDIVMQQVIRYQDKEARINKERMSSDSNTSQKHYSQTIPTFYAFTNENTNTNNNDNSSNTNSNKIRIRQKRRFQCLYCDKSFGKSSHLRDHHRTHSGERPFGCRYCGKSFSQFSNLRTHLRIHTGEKPFKCHICEKSFTQRVTLRSHLRTHGNKGLST